MMNIVFILAGALLFFFFSRSLFGMMFSMDDYRNHQKRMRQLQFTDEGKAKIEGTEKAIETVTSPVIQYLLPFLKKTDTEKLKIDLKISGWDTYYTLEQFVAMRLILKGIAVVSGILLYQIAPFFGVVGFLLFFFGFSFLMKNAAEENRKKIFNSFPGFIRIIQGYLSAGIPLATAIEESFPYMSPEWKVIMKKFLVNANLLSLSDAIERLNEEIDIFEIQEFFSLVKLNLEQGIDINESFSSQREKVLDMQYEVILNKIGQRQIMATVVQAPSLLALFVAFGLPTFHSMMNLT